MKIRVFHFILDHRPGGPHAYVRNLEKLLGPNIESVVVTSGRGQQTDIALFNLRHSIRLLYPLEVFINTLWVWNFFWRKSTRQGVIFDVHGAGNLAPILAARLLSIPTVWHFHETVSDLSTLADLGKKIISGIPHRIVTVARKSALVFGLHDAIHISGAVDFEFWSSIKSDLKLRSNGDRLRILSVGNINPLKGIDILLNALEKFECSLELVVVGAELQNYSTYARQLHEHALRLESSSRMISFVGWQYPWEIRDLLVASDVFILPSRSEACPLVLLEAMAAGCVCIATDVGDVREILEITGSGIVVPSESSSSLAMGLEYVNEMSSDQRLKMGKLAQETVRVRYSVQQQAEKHVAIYLELASMNEVLT